MALLSGACVDLVCEADVRCLWLCVWGCGVQELDELRRLLREATEARQHEVGTLSTPQHTPPLCGYLETVSASNAVAFLRSDG